MLEELAMVVFTCMWLFCIYGVWDESDGCGRRGRREMGRDGTYRSLALRWTGAAPVRRHE